LWAERRARRPSFCGLGLLAQAETTGRNDEFAIEPVATIFAKAPWGEVGVTSPDYSH
jgi:hypothetical protein